MATLSHILTRRGRGTAKRWRGSVATREPNKRKASVPGSNRARPRTSSTASRSPSSCGGGHLAPWHGPRRQFVRRDAEDFGEGGAGGGVPGVAAADGDAAVDDDVGPGDEGRVVARKVERGAGDVLGQTGLLHRLGFGGVFVDWGGPLV